MVASILFIFEGKEFKIELEKRSSSKILFEALLGVYRFISHEALRMGLPL